MDELAAALKKSLQIALGLRPSQMERKHQIRFDDRAVELMRRKKQERLTSGCFMPTRMAGFVTLNEEEDDLFVGQ